MTARLIQAYQQAPWRIQVQRLGKVMLALVAIGLVAGLYLNITAVAATAGLRIRAMNIEKSSALRQIADLNSELAALTSAVEMDRRAQEMGFKMLSHDQALYIMLPGYIGRQPADLAPAPSAQSIPRPIIKPSYTQSLWDWLSDGLASWEVTNGGSSP